jgi:hypothetical protein
MHELVHALTGKYDNWNQTDYKGDAVKHDNQISRELGIAERLSYISMDHSSSYQRLNYEYTNGKPIDAAVTLGTVRSTAWNSQVSTSNLQEWSSVELGESRDLLIGAYVSEKLSSGAGNDFLFGGEGDDTLDGGTREDTAVYYWKRNEYKSKQNADGSWMIFDKVGSADLFTQDANGNWIEKPRKENDGTDKLESIELLQFDNKIFSLYSGQDIAFVIDVTRSMEDDLATVRARISQILDTAFGGESTIEASRIAVVIYDGSVIETILPFSYQEFLEDRKNAVLASVKNLSTSGKTENTNAALLHALDGGAGQWRTDATARRIILFTDEAGDDNGRQGEVAVLAQSLGVEITSALPAGGYSLQENDKPKPPAYARAAENAFFTPVPIPPPPASPLVLDLDGDGVELTTLAEQVVRFDIDMDGFREATGWVKADDGLLVYDRNGDGFINDVSELFGTQVTSDSGFNRLKELDTGSDLL